MYKIGDVIFCTGNYPSIPVTRHVIDDKIKVVDSDGKEQYLYHLSGYNVYFPESELIERFSLVIEGEAGQGIDGEGTEGGE